MITTHVLDTSRGTPAIGLGVVLEMNRGIDWVVLGRADTVDRSHLSEKRLDGGGAGNDRFRHEPGTLYADHPSDLG